MTSFSEVAPDNSAIQGESSELSSLREAIEVRAGSSFLAILVCPGRRDVCRKLQSEFEDTTGTKIAFETDHPKFQSHVDRLRTSGARRLVIIFSTFFDAKLCIPESFTSCEIVCCHGVQANFKPDSTYSGIPLASWNTRCCFPSHQLTSGPSVSFQVLEYCGPRSTPPFQLNNASDAEPVARQITSMMNDVITPETAEQPFDIRSWLAGVSGVSTFGLIVTNFEFKAKGAFIHCQGQYPITAGIGAMSATLSTSGLLGAGAVGVAAGVAVGAAVYFIPWSTLATWFREAWDHFFGFLKAVWRFFRTKFEEFVAFVAKLVEAVRTLVRAAAVGLAAGTLYVGGKVISNIYSQGDVNSSQTSSSTWRLF